MLSGCNKIGNNSKLQEFFLRNHPVTSHIIIQGPEEV